MHMSAANTSIVYEAGDAMPITCVETDVVCFFIFALVIKIAALIVNRMAKQLKRLVSWFVDYFVRSLKIYCIPYLQWRMERGVWKGKEGNLRQAYVLKNDSHRDIMPIRYCLSQHSVLTGSLKLVFCRVVGFSVDIVRRINLLTYLGLLTYSAGGLA